MFVSKKKLYSILFIACVAGYIWLYGVSSSEDELLSVEVCPIKFVTNIPCPSCGSTRSVLSLMQGNFENAVLLNPLGVIIAFIMFASPFWISFDLIFQKKTLFDFYCMLEIKLKKIKFAVPLILLVIVNWIWNIYKEL